MIENVYTVWVVKPTEFLLHLQHVHVVLVLVEGAREP